MIDQKLILETLKNKFALEIRKGLHLPDLRTGPPASSKVSPGQGYIGRLTPPTVSHTHAHTHIRTHTPQGKRKADISILKSFKKLDRL